MMGSEKSEAIEVAELLLTADIYNRSEKLTEDDLPPEIYRRPDEIASAQLGQLAGISLEEAEKERQAADLR